MDLAFKRQSTSRCDVGQSLAFAFFPDSVSGADRVWSREGMDANAFNSKMKLKFFDGTQLFDPDNLLDAGFRGNKWPAMDNRDG